jgi:preprotein translocase subunit SecG
MQTVLVIIHLMIVLAMTGLVLLQKSEGGGLGMGGGGGFLSTRGTSNMLTRSTAILAAIFFATSLLLSILAGIERKPRSILDSSGAPPASPSMPLGSGRGAPVPAPTPAPPAPGPQTPPQ